MSDPFNPERTADLRRRAASRLTGPASTKGPSLRAADALAVLHALASSPDTASDALTLLHELQVHQVEIDLQAQELLDSRAELECALRRQIELYDFQPVGCFTIDARLVVHELNLSAAEMLGIERENAFGLGLGGFLDAQSQRLLATAIAGVDARLRQPACLLRLRSKGGSERAVLAGIGADPAATDRYFVSFLNTGD